MISDTSPEEGSYKVVKSPVRLVVILAVVIFMIEVLVMLLVLSVPGLVGWRAAFVDAALLVILVTPVLYTAAVIPMVRYNVKLDKMEAERNSFFECSLDMLCIAHTDGYFKRINPAFEETLGWSTAELLARPFLDFIHPDDLAATLVEVDKLAAGESVISFQNRYQCKDGSWRWLSWKSTATSEGAIFATARDITEIELTQEALRESEEKYRTVFESSADAIMTIAPPLWNFTSANPATLSMFECVSEDDFYLIGPSQLSPECQPDGRPSAEKAMEAIKKALSNGSNYFEWTHQRLNGEEFPATVLLTRMKLDGQVYLQATIRDITERKTAETELAEQAIQLEAALRETQESKALILRNDKLASLGRMSAGLIHEINNPLNYAKQGVYLLKRNSQDNLLEERREDFLDILNDVEEGVTRAITIISDLRDFTRVSYDHIQTLELNRLVKKSLRFFAHEFKDKVSLKVEVPEGIEICGNANHLVQVLINLLQNALDSVDAKPYEEGSTPCVLVTATPGDQEILLKLRDNGSGISPEHMDNIFDPFYTTKDVGKGTGLGLAICHRIMREHGGGIEVYSEPQGFCEFTLTFPSAHSSASADRGQSAGEAAPVGSVNGEV